MLVGAQLCFAPGVNG